MHVAMNLLSSPTRFQFFTGKGGVGKTSVSAAVAITLADAGRRVLLVSTDAASNLDEMLGVPLSNRHPRPAAAGPPGRRTPPDRAHRQRPGPTDLRGAVAARAAGRGASAGLAHRADKRALTLPPSP